jgi:hypothetical protein
MTNCRNLEQRPIRLIAIAEVIYDDRGIEPRHDCQLTGKDVMNRRFGPETRFRAIGGLRWPLRADTRKVLQNRKIAGDGIRTHDVQLGNSLLGAQVAMAQLLITRFSPKNEGYN